MTLSEQLIYAVYAKMMSFEQVVFYCPSHCDTIRH